MLDSIRTFWNDPVASKIISTILVAIGVAFWARSKALVKKWRQDNLRIKLIDTSIPDPDPNRTYSYPVKCYIEISNESPQSVDVRATEFHPNAVTLRKFVREILQVRLGSWCPTPDGVDHIAVLPYQSFRAWVGIDETKFTAAQVRGLKGKLGTLYFVVNGKTMPIQF